MNLKRQAGVFSLLSCKALQETVRSSDLLLNQWESINICKTGGISSQ